MIIIKIRKKFAKKRFAPGLVHGVMQEKVYDVLGTPPQHLAGVRGVNVRPNPRTRHEPDTGFFGLGLGLNGFGS